MKIVLSDTIKASGISESDVYNMLRACDEHRREQYEPSDKQVKELLHRAYALESSKQRIVLAWLSAMTKLS